MSVSPRATLLKDVIKIATTNLKKNLFINSLEKACNHPMLILILRLPASDLLSKQARTVHSQGREPSELLALT